MRSSALDRAAAVAVGHRFGPVAIYELTAASVAIVSHIDERVIVRANQADDLSA